LGDVKAGKKIFDKDFEKNSKKIAQDPYALIRITVMRAIFSSALGRYQEAARFVDEMC